MGRAAGYLLARLAQTRLGSAVVGRMLRSAAWDGLAGAALGWLTRNPARLTDRLLDWQSGHPASGVAGVSFVETRAGRDGAVAVTKVRAFVSHLCGLDRRARGRLARLVVTDLVTGAEKRRREVLLPEPERWRARLKWVFLTAFDACNLRCRGCYVRQRDLRPPSLERLDFVVREARRLGVFQVHIVGRGEAFCREEYRAALFDLARRHGDVRFTILTNGTCVTPADARRLGRLGNVIPFVSIDGLGEVNDARRGAGVYARLRETFRALREAQVLFCFSTTVHRANFEHVTSEEFVERLTAEGARLGIYCQYERCGRDVDSAMLLRPQEAAAYAERLAEQNERAGIPLRDQTLLEKARGCQARLGRSVYIDGLSGAVSPCFKTPFAPSDCNLYTNARAGRLEEILGGAFFRRYRGEHVAGRECFTHMPLERAWFARAPEMDAGTRRDLARPAEATEEGSLAV